MRCWSSEPRPARKRVPRGPKLQALRASPYKPKLLTLHNLPQVPGRLLSLLRRPWGERKALAEPIWPQKLARVQRYVVYRL